MRIDWGYFYLAAPKAAIAAKGFASRDTLEHGFAEGGSAMIPANSPDQPSRADEIGAGLALKVGAVSRKAVSGWLMLAYDDLYSIQYMKKNLRPYWRRNGWEAADLLKAAAQDYEIAARNAARRLTPN